jgi:hypothetical protein
MDLEIAPFVGLVVYAEGQLMHPYIVHERCAYPAATALAPNA